MKNIANPQFQGVIITPLVGLIVTVELIFWGVILTPKSSLKNSFSGITPDIEELNNPIFGVILTPDWE